MEQHEQIMKFIEGTVAEGAPVIPISAQLKYNIEVTKPSRGVNSSLFLWSGGRVSFSGYGEGNQVKEGGGKRKGRLGSFLEGF